MLYKRETLQLVNHEHGRLLKMFLYSLIAATGGRRNHNLEYKSAKNTFNLKDYSWLFLKLNVCGSVILACPVGFVKLFTARLPL